MMKRDRDVVSAIAFTSTTSGVEYSAALLSSVSALQPSPIHCRHEISLM